MTTAAADSDTASLDPANPFASASTLPYGLPDFSAIRPEHFLPALRAGIAEQKQILQDLSTDTAPVTWANLMEPLERGSAVLDRTAAAFFHLVSADGIEELQTIESEIVPELTALEDALYLDDGIFTRLTALRETADAGALSPALTAEEAHILELLYLRFRLRGAELDDAGRTRLSELNQQISEAQTSFSQAVKADLKAATVHVTEEHRLHGLSSAQLAGARTAAKEAGRDGFLISLILPTEQPLLTVLSDRATREQLYRASIDRGTATWESAARVAELRGRKAQLLGFEDFASLAVADRTAARPEAVEDLFEQATAPAMRNADREAERLAEAARADGIESLQPWDWAYYANKVQAEDFAVDRTALQPYFVLDQVIADGVFHAAHELYGLDFAERTDLVAPHPDARIWEVTGADGQGVGLFIGDYFSRVTKRGGAWMNTLVDQSHAEGTRPVVMNTLNIPKPAPGSPAFVTLDEVNTLFHEFGHALHALLSDVEYRSASGTSVPRDVVEFPSQVNEMWALRPGIVEHYARHVGTGEPVPPELLEPVRASAQWNEGFRTVEYLAAAVLDWRWHRLAPGTRIEDPHAFEAEQLADAGLSHPLIAPRYRTGYFNHTFSGGYAAGYYSYLWAEVFDADSVAWFDEQLAGGSSLREVGAAFASGVLAIGGSRDLVEAYREFRGRDRDVRYLLERRGLA
jgi:peptidyl-dipeptidase Dcp